MQRALLGLTLAALAAPALAQFTVTVPPGFANSIGNSNNAYPWSRTTSSMRFQQVYDSSNWTIQGINYPIVISGIRYRPYPGATTSWTGGTWPNIRIDLASCPTDFTAVSSTFASNLGPDLATVLTGPVTVNGGSTLGAGVLVPWHIDIPFTTSFVYDPSLGNDLTLDVYLDGTGWTGTSRGLDVVSGTTAPNVALGSRIYATAGLAATTGSIGLNHSLICEFTYMPAAGLYAAFNADVTGGVTPLSVNFTDASFSSDPGGITSWAWDFDGDNVVDSTLQNPTFVYTNCGTYNVSLTITDATHAPNTLTRTAYIQTDRITADFTSQVIGPMTVQFTDASNPAPTSWAWDLDGDNVVDSTAQNPVWVYATTNPVNVTLTATRLCAPASTVTKVVVPAQQISHNVAPNNGLSSGASVYFDANIINPLGVAISSMDVFGSVVNVPFSVDMYIKPGSHVGFEGTAAEWALVGTASGTSASATTLPSNALFPQAIYLPTGQYGIKLLYNGTGPRYMNVTGPSTVANGDLSLTLGVSRGSTVANPWAGSNIANRAWSGTFYYGTQNITGAAAYGTFGPGCAGSMGVSKLTANTPQLGNTLNVTVNNLPFNAAFMMVGFSNTTSIFGPLPVDASVYGATGCFGRVSTEVSVLLLGTGNTAVWNFVIPNDPGFQGMPMFNQAIVLDTGFNPLGAVLSDAAAMLIGQ